MSSHSYDTDREHRSPKQPDLGATPIFRESDPPGWWRRLAGKAMLGIFAAIVASAILLALQIVASLERTPDTSGSPLVSRPLATARAQTAATPSSGQANAPARPPHASNSVGDAPPRRAIPKSRPTTPSRFDLRPDDY